MGFLRDLIVRIRGDKTSLDSTLSQSESRIAGWGKRILGIFAAAFGVRAIINFSKEAMKLAAEAEGVRNAFMKIGDAQSVLESMKKATRGVIEESDLMRLAIKAQNFKIPLQDLSKYLDFATKRAIITGKSVGDLTDLIVTGIGRKSSRSMIQLGLSAKEVQAAFKETGGFMRLVTAESAKMGDVADTAGIAYGRLAAQVKDLKEKYGEWLNQSKAVSNVTRNLTDAFTMIGDSTLTFWQKLGVLNTVTRRHYIEKKEAIINEKAALDLLKGGTIPAIEKEIETIQTLNEKVTEYKAELLEVDINDKAYLKTLADKIKLTEDYIKLLQSGQAVAPGSIKAPSKIAGKSGTIPVTGEFQVPGLADMNIKPVLERQFTELEEMFIDAGRTLEGLAADLVEGIAAALSGGDMKDIGKNLLMSFANFLSMFGKLLIVYAIGSKEFWSNLGSGGKNWPLALGAGIAMIVAAGLIKGALSHASQTVSSGMGGGGGGHTAMIAQQNMKIIVEGVIKGRDIYISGQRYVADSDRST